MPSIVPGFEYDIFISYRHNDNRSGWVTDFVNALQEELAATIKEPLSIYFDKNPHDGLLETHNVDKSLEGKLKCLIFIPIISQTYCDPKSFAWQHEFCAFNSMCNEDAPLSSGEGPGVRSIGRDIKLSNGNVASRILPIKIHELDDEDKSTIENEIGGALRAIEFIFKSPGVNRPLTTNDKREENSNKTFYRDQVNKAANAIKEIIYGLKDPKLKVSVNTGDASPLRLEKSIVVLPFVNMSNDTEQEYFSDGLTEEIITDLSRLHDLLVISRSSAMTFKNSNKKISEIVHELNVSYVLEGSVRKAGNNLRITAQLIDAGKDVHVWAEKYDGKLDDVFDIQEKVSRAIVNELKLKLNSRENLQLTERPMKNAEAYDYYLRARRELIQWNEPSFDKALKFLQESIKLEGPNALVYGAMAYVYWSYSNMGIAVEKNTAKAEEFVAKTFAIDPTSADAHLALALLNFAFRGKVHEGVGNLKKVIEVRPNDFDALMWLAVGYYMQGKPEHALPYHEKMNRVDPASVIGVCAPGIAAFYKGDFVAALEPAVKAYHLEPANFFYILFQIIVLGCIGDFRRAKQFALKHIKEDATDHLNSFYRLCVYAFDQDNAGMAGVMTPDFKEFGKRDPQWSHFMAQVFSFGRLKNETFEWIENAVDRSFCNYPLLSTKDPINKLLAGDPRFDRLQYRMKNLWEKFD
jgi:TolB-like protein